MSRDAKATLALAASTDRHVPVNLMLAWSQGGRINERVSLWLFRPSIVHIWEYWTDLVTMTSRFPRGRIVTVTRTCQGTFRVRVASLGSRCVLIGVRTCSGRLHARRVCLRAAAHRAVLAARGVFGPIRVHAYPSRGCGDVLQDYSRRVVRLSVHSLYVRTDESFILQDREDGWWWAQLGNICIKPNVRASSCCACPAQVRCSSLHPFLLYPYIRTRLRLQFAAPCPSASLNLTVFNAPAAGARASLGRHVATSGPYSDAVSGVLIEQLTLQQGRYLVVPSTYNTGVEAGFRLIVYSNVAGVQVVPVQR